MRSSAASLVTRLFCCPCHCRFLGRHVRDVGPTPSPGASPSPPPSLPYTASSRQIGGGGGVTESRHQPSRALTDGGAQRGFTDDPAGSGGFELCCEPAGSRHRRQRFADAARSNNRFPAAARERRGSSRQHHWRASGRCGYGVQDLVDPPDGGAADVEDLTPNNLPLWDFGLNALLWRGDGRSTTPMRATNSPHCTNRTARRCWSPSSSRASTSGQFMPWSDVPECRARVCRAIRRWRCILPTSS